MPKVFVHNNPLGWLENLDFRTKFRETADPMEGCAVGLGRFDLGVTRAVPGNRVIEGCRSLSSTGDNASCLIGTIRSEVAITNPETRQPT